MLNVRKVWFSANFSDAINVQNNLDIFSDLISFLITVLISVSCDHVTSFNYDDKEARDVGPTCGSHLRIIMADSIFHEKTWDRDNLFLFFCFCFCFFILFVLLFECCQFLFRGDTSVFLRIKDMKSVLSQYHQWHTMADGIG